MARRVGLWRPDRASEAYGASRDALYLCLLICADGIHATVKASG
jgi:hypothetical protein